MNSLETLGNEHLSVSKTLSQVGCVRFKLSNFNEAMEALTEAENHQLSSVGDLNRETLETQVRASFRSIF